MNILQLARECDVCGLTTGPEGYVWIAGKAVLCGECVAEANEEFTKIEQEILNRAKRSDEDSNAH